LILTDLKIKFLCFEATKIGILLQILQHNNARYADFANFETIFAYFESRISV